MERQFGIITCGSGIGVSIVSNKITDIRAANCLNEDMARLARQHNNANVLNMGSRFISIEDAKKIIDTFLMTEFEGGRHVRRVSKVHELTGR
jgi:ribose 5-phosphate isomerase B